MRPPFLVRLQYLIAFNAFRLKTYLKYENPIAHGVFEVRFALASRGYGRHQMYTCPDNDVCEGHAR